MKRILLIIGLFTCFQAVGQELDFNVKVSTSPALRKTDPRIFQTLEQSVQEFINNNKWTSDEFEDEERIKGDIQITIVNDPSTTSFVADILVQSIRPVYGSDYSTQLINYKDKSIAFDYVELQPLENSINDFKDNLSSVILYYIYYALGLDYDSFSPLGGEKYFQICKNIASSIPPNVSNKDKGWDISNDLGRAKMIESYLSPASRKIREAYYYYHRMGLDEASNDLGKAKAAMLSVLKDVQTVNASVPNSPSVQMFMDSKRREIVDIFIQSDRGQVSRVYDILMEIDPSQSTIYNQLKSK